MSNEFELPVPILQVVERLRSLGCAAFRNADGSYSAACPCCRKPDALQLHSVPSDNDRYIAPCTGASKCDPASISQALGLFTIERQVGSQVVVEVHDPRCRLPKSPIGAIHQAAYHGLSGELVRTIEPHTESDPVAILIQFLTAFGNRIGRSACFGVESTRHYMNLFCVLVGMSAKARKGTSWEHVKATFEQIGGGEVALRIQTGLSSGEGLIHAVRDTVEERVPVREQTRVIDYQTVVKDPGSDDKRLLVVEPEFSRVLKVIGRENNILSSVSRDAWDNGNMNVLTKQAQKATGAHISVIAHITRDELRRRLNDTEAGNGFANRFLWFHVQRSQMLPDGGMLHLVDKEKLYRDIAAAVEFGSTVRQMRRSEDAAKVWREEYPHLTRDEYGLFGAVTSRAEAQVLRLSCLYALLDLSDTIQLPHLEAALAVWRYSEKSARHIFGDALGDPLADAILPLLQNAPNGLSRTEISNRSGRHYSSERLSAALNTLQEHGEAQAEKVRSNGRDAEIWTAVNAVDPG